MRKRKVQIDSPGEAKVLWTNSDGGAVRLSNFGIGKHDLKPEHKAALSLYVVPVLAAGGSALVMGLTSRSGSTFTNQKLSERRAAAVIGQLQRQLGFIPVIAQEHCAGEAAAALAGAPDRQEHPNWRGSIVIYSKRRTPPKPPPHIPSCPW
jgi:outer membrane protein OmpA-like peptidoglycan-associated protein